MENYKNLKMGERKPETNPKKVEEEILKKNKENLNRFLGIDTDDLSVQRV